MDHAPTPDLDALHRRYDGPAPAGALRKARLGGTARADALRRSAILALHDTLAAEARLGVARRRELLSWADSASDAWLARLAATLAHHRHAAVALRLSGTRIPNRAPAPA
ncbi:hypothetical protein [Azospirillum doebereinerae]|uniref:hypothetical protein n=1 Tax=Azospirillum doebereinerae TaxID=92933 RepID=UPI001EE527EE|nr:hypothetical protein [Azospirillum doebereinerae]MCG5240128.1 hypothetical protein [Azospirillum doebereinerae]